MPLDRAFVHYQPGVFMRACLRLFRAAQFCCLSLLCAGVALIAGCGGAGISFANQNAKVTIDENKDGFRVDRQGDSIRPQLCYQLYNSAWQGWRVI